jgi:hypothetical protein
VRWTALRELVEGVLKDSLTSFHKPSNKYNIRGGGGDGVLAFFQKKMTELLPARREEASGRTENLQAMERFGF